MLLTQDFSKEAGMFVRKAIEARTKAAFTAELNLAIDMLNAEESQTVEEVPVTELERITIAIGAVISSQAKGYFHLGQLLKEAKETFDTTQEFLKWADDNFSFKKAYVYRVMQVATKFSDEVWHGVPANNLFILSQQGTEDDIENAKLFIQKGGKLNIANLSVLLDGQAQNKRSATKAADSVAAEEALQDAAKELSGAILNDAVVDCTPKIPQVGQVVAKHETTQPEPAGAAESLMTEQLAEALKQIAELTRQLAEANKPKLRDLSSIPMLRQFKSPCLRTRLGLSEEEANDKAIILEAFKEFCRAGYGRGHEAYSLIDEARHTLIHSIKVVA